jgi:hypothetical protein
MSDGCFCAWRTDPIEKLCRYCRPLREDLDDSRRLEADLEADAHQEEDGK